MNSPRKPRSRQDVLKRQQQSTFVGREEYITTFRHNLTLPPADWYFLFNIWGQGGVGKSTLLRQFRKIAEEAGFVAAYTSDADTSVLEVMKRLADQLRQQGYLLHQFADRYKVYLQKQQELEADPNAPQGLSAFWGRSIAKASLGLVKQLPGSGAVTPFLDEETIAAQTGEWASYIARKIGNKDEAHLVQQPIEVLTPLLLQDLGKVAEQANLLLLFDTYERTSGFLDGWLREILEGHYGDLPINLVMVIAGREALERNFWSDYEGAISRVPLSPFTEAEAQQYLNRKGITNPQVIDVILRLSGRLPLLIATLAAESPTDPTQIGDPSGTAVERFLKWVDDPQRHQVALNAALPRHLNRDVIAVLQGEASADELFNWLKQMPFVENRPGGWAYHDIARTQMLRHKRLTSPQGWADLHGKLADYYERLQQGLQLPEEQQWSDPNWQDYALNALYHRLCQMPQQHLVIALNQFLATHNHHRPLALKQAEVICQAGKDTEANNVCEWGERMINGSARAYMGQDKNRDVISLFTDILEHPGLDAKLRVVALDKRGGAYRLLGRNEEALKDFDEVIALDPDHARSIASRGVIYYQLGDYEKALQDLNRAIELKPKFSWALVRRGWIYNSLWQYDKAIENFDKALEIHAQDSWAMASRGRSYSALERYEEALIEYNQALEWIESIEGHEWMLVERGVILRVLDRYEEALKDFDRAIESNPKFRFFLKRGETYLMLRNYGAACSDFKRAIELMPDNDWCFYDRALVHIALNQPENARADLDRAIQLAQQRYQENPEHDRNTLNLALYYLAANNIDQSRHFYQEALHKGASKPRIQEAIRDLENFLKLFLGHRSAQQMREALFEKVRTAQ